MAIMAMVQGQTKLLLFSALVFGGVHTQALYLKIISLATMLKSSTNSLMILTDLLFQSLLVTSPYLNFSDYENIQSEFKKMHKHIRFKPSLEGGHLR